MGGGFRLLLLSIMVEKMAPTDTIETTQATMKVLGFGRLNTARISIRSSSSSQLSLHDKSGHRRIKRAELTTIFAEGGMPQK